MAMVQGAGADCLLALGLYLLRLNGYLLGFGFFGLGQSSNPLLPAIPMDRQPEENYRPISWPPCWRLAGLCLL